MSTAEALAPLTPLEELRQARDVLRREGEAIACLAQTLEPDICEAAAMCDAAEGVVVTGMGKAGLIGRKIAATLASLGVGARTLHPAEAVHGDLGGVRSGEVVLALSHSGQTEELLRLIPALKRNSLPIIALTASRRSRLARAADIVIELGRLEEAGPFGLAPTTSTTVMLAVGDALAVLLANRRQFTPRQFAIYHPAGSLGRKLMRVGQLMRTGQALRLAPQAETIRNVLAGAPHPGRRTGAVMLVDENGVLTGLFTDSDLARLLEHRREAQLDRPIQEVMTRDPTTLTTDQTLGEVLELLGSRKFSELPVVDEAGQPLGLIDITDILPLLPDDERS